MNSIRWACRCSRALSRSSRIRRPASTSIRARTSAASFFIDHGTGVVIGETALIGQRVRLYQAVTLGAKSFPAAKMARWSRASPRHPIVEDDVVIYAGATILGRVTIGRGSTIGGNVWITRDVPPGSRVTQAQARSEAFETAAASE